MNNKNNKPWGFLKKEASNRCKAFGSLLCPVTWDEAPPAGVPSVSTPYFLIAGFTGGGGAAAGEIESVSHTFQPSGRCSAANSL